MIAAALRLRCSKHVCSRSTVQHVAVPATHAHRKLAPKGTARATSLNMLGPDFAFPLSNSTGEDLSHALGMLPASLIALITYTQFSLVALTRGM